MEQSFTGLLDSGLRLIKERESKGREPDLKAKKENAIAGTGSRNINLLSLF
jgi:hypothetical protein